MAKRRMLTSMHRNSYGSVICTCINVDGYYEDFNFMGYSKKEIVKKLRGEYECIVPMAATKIDNHIGGFGI